MYAMGLMKKERNQISVFSKNLTRRSKKGWRYQKGNQKP